jgi:hypothetical protein
MPAFDTRKLGVELLDDTNRRLFRLGVLGSDIWQRNRTLTLHKHQEDIFKPFESTDEPIRILFALTWLCGKSMQFGALPIEADTDLNPAFWNRGRIENPIPASGSNPVGYPQAFDVRSV